MIKVTVWDDCSAHNNPKFWEVYPKGQQQLIADFLSKNPNYEVKTTTLLDEEQGLSEEVLNNTDVLLWWSHGAHHLVEEQTVTRVHEAVLKGMGFMPLHSSHFSKTFKSLMGTSCTLAWRDDEFERIWNVNPNHPIAKGIPEYFELEEEEMYGEFFDVPTPDELIFMGWYRSGEVFRSGCVWNRGYGKVFFFQPGHETNKSYYNEYIQKIIDNGVSYIAPIKKITVLECPHVEKDKTPEKLWEEKNK